MLKYAFIFLVVVVCLSAGVAQTVSVYQTTPDMTQQLEQKSSLTFSASGSASLVITIDEAKTYQKIDGFGASFTDSSAWLMYTKLTADQRDSAMHKLFDRNSGIGLSFIRQPMGASDLALNFYTYDDMPQGQSDPNLDHFSIDHDKAYIVPVLQQALAINPNIKMMANPWSPPAWMKTNNSLLGAAGGNSGSLKADAYGSLSNYFVKYIQAYQALGIKTDYISMQNEPLYAPPGYTGMLMQTSEQAKLLNNYIAPAFASAGIKTKVLLYDHNWDRSDYPRTLLADATTRANAGGVAWHHYAGDPAVMSTIHDLHPELDAWETEASGGDWQSGNMLVEEGKELVNSMRNWARSYVLWNMALDQDRGPYATTQDGQHGCNTCRGILKITWDKTGGGAPSSFTPELDYYVLGHASKFLQPNAYRIYSDENVTSGLYDVAFRNPDGSIVLYTVNAGTSDITFSAKFQGQYFTATVKAGSVATFTWIPTTAPKVSLSHEPNGATLSVAQSADIGVTVEPLSGTPTVTMSCTATDLSGTATSKIHCAVSPQNLSFSDANPQSVKLTVSTGSTSGSNRPGNPFAMAGALGAVVLVGGAASKNDNRHRNRLALGVLLALALLMVSCGGGGGTTSGGGGVNPPSGGGGGTTPTPTSYLVNVVATTDTGAPVSLSVQVLVN